MQRVLVSGANKGIGLALVRAILVQQPQVFVFLGARSLERGEEARTELIREQPSWASRVHVLQLDVTDDESVEAAARRVREWACAEEAPLYGVVNNAGVGGSELSLSEVLNVNVLGVRRVCEAFLPLLDPERGRIVNVTSAAGPSFVATCSQARQRLFVDEELTWPQLHALIQECQGVTGGSAAFAALGLGDGNAYGLSKACANSYTLLLARRYPRLRVNACTPGFIETDMTRGYAEAHGKSPAELGMKPPEAGTLAPLFLLFGAPEGSGRYYGSDAKRSPLDRYRAPGTEPYRG